jgi:hypothetical protein
MYNPSLLGKLKKGRSPALKPAVESGFWDENA